MWGLRGCLATTPHPLCFPPRPPTSRPPPLPLSCRKLEDQLDRKTAELIALRKLAMAADSAGALEDVQQRLLALQYGAADGGGIGGGVTEDGAPGSVARSAAAGGAAGAAARGPQPVGAWALEGGESPAPGPAQQHQGGGGGSSSGGGDGEAAALRRQLEEVRLEYSREAAGLAESEARWRQQAEVLQAQVDELRAEGVGAVAAAAATVGGSEDTPGLIPRPASAAAAVEAAEARAEGLVREMEALRTILDGKVRVLVEEVARSVAELPEGGTAAHPKLGRQLEYLGKLVRATVQAMSSAADGGSSSTGGSEEAGGGSGGGSASGLA